MIEEEKTDSHKLSFDLHKCAVVHPLYRNKELVFIGAQVPEQVVFILQIKPETLTYLFGKW